MAAHRRFRRDSPVKEEAPVPAFEWKRGECLALANQRCTFCFGLGARAGRAGRASVCNCVLRAIFRACFRRFRQCASKEKYVCQVSLEANPGRQRKSTYGRKNEEYMADFVLVARRILDDAQYGLFKFHFLLGADWKLCTRKLGLDRGEFFHEVYRVEQKLGRAFREMQPYGLFPLDEYFGGTQKVSTPNELDALFPVESPEDAEGVSGAKAEAATPNGNRRCGPCRSGSACSFAASSHSSLRFPVKEASISAA
jgi:hypothetical protein